MSALSESLLCTSLDGIHKHAKKVLEEIMNVFFLVLF